MAGPACPVILDIYATAHSRLGATTPEYVEQAMIAGNPAADGVMIYCHQDPKSNPKKYLIIKRLFGSWACEGAVGDGTEVNASIKAEASSRRGLRGE